MIAYNRLWITNLFTRQQAAEAFEEGQVSKEQLAVIEASYPVKFYSPNFFIRIGLFILTTVILLFSFGLCALLFIDSIDKALGELAIFFGLLSYAVLEYMVQNKNHFQSGVDDALLWISACSLFGGILSLANTGGLANCVILFVLSFYCAVRFADRLMTAVAYASLLGIIFFCCTITGGAIKAFVPFVLMAISLLIYLLTKKLKGLHPNHFYFNCLQVISIAALVSFYLSGNYYVVRELSNEMFGLHLTEKQGIPLGWLFWFFTLAIPCGYILLGIQNKDIILIRVGLLLVAVIIFTVRHYYFIASVELSMTIGGIILVGVAYALTRYLKIPKFGFTYLDINPEIEKEKLQLESMLLAQTFAKQPNPAEGTHFGGGSFGGGGASGEF